MDILDGLETMLDEEGSGVSVEILLDTTDMITAILMAGEIQPIVPNWRRQRNK